MEIVVQWFKESGIEVPIYANGWSPYYQNFCFLREVVDLVGIDIYPLPYIKGSKITPDEWLSNVDYVKLSRGELGYCWSAEFQSGNYPIKFTGYLPPDHFKYVAFSLMANGLSGWNWYMLVTRDNWSNCPINEWGRGNEYFPVHKEIVRIAHEVRPWNTETFTDVSLLVYKPHRMISPGNWDRVFYALNEADIDFMEYDIETQRLPETRALIYAGSNWLPRNLQKKLLTYVEDGGILILFNEFPEEDEYNQPLNILGLKSPQGARPVLLPVKVVSGKEELEIINAGHLGRKVNFFYFKEVEGDPIFVSLSPQTKELLVDIGLLKEKSFIMGYRRKTGKGWIIHLGSNPSGNLIKFSLSLAGINWYVTTSTPGVLTYLHRDRENHSLIIYVVNREETPKLTEVFLQKEAIGLEKERRYILEEITGKSKQEIPGEKLVSLSFYLEGNSVAIWRIKC